MTQQLCHSSPFGEGSTASVQAERRLQAVARADTYVLSTHAIPLILV